MKLTWTKQVLKLSKSILSKHENFDEAIFEIETEIKHKVTYDSIYRAFRANGLPSPQTFLKKPEYIPDPIERKEKLDKEAQHKQHLESLVKEVREARARQSFLDEVGDINDPPKILPREKKSGMRNVTAVALGSDWHVEEVVEPESVAYRNEYNLEIAEKRILRFFQGIIWNIEHQRASGKISIKDLVLALLGDMMTGYIHEELLEANALSPTETIRWLIPKIKNGIYSLLEHLDLEHIEIPCSYGNHGRTTAKRRVSTGYSNSYEWLMYHTLADMFEKEKRVHFEITNSPHQYVQVYNFILHFHHGDEVKYQGGVGGLGIPLLKAVPQWDLIKKADIHNIGHHHSFRDYGRAVVNGSLIGYNPYAQSIRAEFEEPQQALYFVDSNRGKCMTTALWVGEDAKQEMPQDKLAKAQPKK